MFSCRCDLNVQLPCLEVRFPQITSLSPMTLNEQWGPFIAEDPSDVDAMGALGRAAWQYLMDDEEAPPGPPSARSAPLPLRISVDLRGTITIISPSNNHS